MKRRTVQIIALCLLISPLAGCGLTSQERVTALQGAVTHAQEISQQLDGQIKILQDAIGQAKAGLTDPNATDAATVYLREALPKLEAKLAAVQPVKKLVDQQLAAFQAQLAALLAAGPVDVQKEFAAYGQGVTSVGSALPPPLNVLALLLGSIGLPLVGAIVGAIAKGRKDQTQLAEVQSTNQTAVAGIVASVSKLLQKLPTEEQVVEATKIGIPANLPIIDVEAAKDTLARAQTKVPEAAAAVRAALDEQAPVTVSVKADL
jgi:hypothetical protein